jgi:hypothetical protein
MSFGNSFNPNVTFAAARLCNVWSVTIRMAIRNISLFALDATTLTFRNSFWVAVLPVNNSAGLHGNV